LYWSSPPVPVKAMIFYNYIVSNYVIAILKHYSFQFSIFKHFNIQTFQFSIFNIQTL
jgi:hypothetical protein